MEKPIKPPSHNIFRVSIFQNQMLIISGDESSRSSWIAEWLYKSNMDTKKQIWNTQRQ